MLDMTGPINSPLSSYSASGSALGLDQDPAGSSPAISTIGAMVIPMCT